ncbi:lysozyme M1, partial [Arthrobacter deserti]|nr:lysozyme M1 [Arthrobacter deserti]
LKAYNHVVAPGDFNGDGRADLIGRKSNGELWFVPGTGKGGYGTAVRIGTGWQIYNLILGVRDFNGDGRNDLVPRHVNGSLWFYAGAGRISSSNEGYPPGVWISSADWNRYAHVAGAGDTNRDGRNDLLAVQADGAAYLYPGLGNGRPGTAKKIGTGWQKFNQLASPGDYTGDGIPDVIARKPDGTLWLLTGRATYAKRWFQASKQIGNGGWNVYPRILGPGDFTSDKKADLLGVTGVGSTWLYRGTAFSNNGLLSGKPTGSL